MEFWVGWFNRWKEPVIRRDPKEMVDAIMEVLEEGSINLYMFHGGTNFGFMNGSSARLQEDLPQVTSYDYDAILDEAGNPTKKYFLLQESLKKHSLIWIIVPLYIMKRLKLKILLYQKKLIWLAL